MKRILCSVVCACTLAASAAVEPRSVLYPSATATPRGIKKDTNTVTLFWPSTVGHGYIIERKQVLSNPWNTLSVQTASSNTCSVGLGAPGFYQVSEAATFTPGQTVSWAITFPDLNSNDLSQATTTWHFDDGTSVTNVSATAPVTKSYSSGGVKTATVNVSHPSGWSVSRLWAISVDDDPIDPPTTNLLANGDFEIVSNALPAGWLEDQWGNNSAQFLYPVTGYGGTGNAIEVNISNWSGGDAKWYQEVPAIPNTTYHYSDWYEASAPNDLTIEFTVTNGASSSSSVFQWITSPPAASVWQHLDATFTSPSNAAAIIVLHNMPTNGWLIIDNAELDIPTNHIDPGPTNLDNLVSNPGFEVASGSSPTGWLQGGYGSNTRTFLYPVPGHQSASAAEVTVSGYASGDAKWYFTDVPASPGQTYYWSDWYMSSVTSDVTVQFTTNSAAGQGFVYMGIATPPPASNWQQAQAYFTAPPNTISFTVFHDISANGNLTIDDVVVNQLKSSGGDPNQGIISITFDDNWETTTTNVPPILAAAGYKATFYVITGVVGEQNYANLNELINLKNLGHEIGAHTVTHPDLVQLSQTDMAAAQAEITQSKQTLINWGFNPTTFAYPFGSYNQTIENMVQQAGFASAVTTDDGYNQPAISNPYTITRNDITANITVAQAESMIDTALANKVWLIILFHHVDNTQTLYSYPVAGFQEIVNYLKSKNATVVTVSQGLQMFAQP